VLAVCTHGLPFAVCDGVPDCIKTVRLQIRKRAKLIKICTSRGVYSFLDSPQDSQLSPEELLSLKAASNTWTDCFPTRRGSSVKFLAIRKAYKLAIKSGFKVTLGTDQATSVDGTYNSHGRNGKEVFCVVNAGMTLQAIETCTTTSPKALGPHVAPNSPQLKEGYDADFIAVSRNPLENIDLLSEAANITHV